MKRRTQWLLVLGLSFLAFGSHSLASPFPPQSSSGSIGLQGEISSAAPTRGATIAVPGNGAVFTNVPITVSGLCPTGLLVKIFSNNVFVGATYCASGSYSVQIDLFSGQNDLVARVYDSLDQAGPDSNTVTVTFNDAQFLQFGTHVELSSAYAERGAPPSQEIDWPILLSGGTGPYAVSVDWGDGSPTDLMSVASAGTITIKHTYKTAGIYKVIVKATDKNGGTAFLQLVGQATGAIQNNAKGGSGNAVIEHDVLWWPALAMFPLIFAAFWIGRRHELYSLRKRLEASRDEERA
ncbi:MAG TPA: PKD domain-containing protein [Verrucomicrobiae bacterium]|nr:PKD domain-containing protein [Verrucomicrobiae bacterium]